MNELQVVGTTNFSLEDEKLSLLTLNIAGDVYFASKMVAELFGYAQPTNAVLKHVSEENKISYIELENLFNDQKSVYSATEYTDFYTEFQKFAIVANINSRLKGELRTTFINEIGFYELLMNSKLPIRSKLMRKVTHEILPSIRKYGVYIDSSLQKDLSAITTLPMEKQLTQEKEARLQELVNQNDNLLLENSDLKKEVTILEKTIITERTIKYINELNGFGDNLDIVSSNIKGRHRPSDICKLFGFSNNRELYPSLRKYGFISPNELTHTSRIPTELAFELNLVKYKNNYSPPMFTDMGLATMFVIFYNNGILDPYYLNIFKKILKLREYDLELIKQNVRKLNEIKVRNNFSLN